RLSQQENKASALSIWSVVNKTFQECHARLSDLPGCKVEIEDLSREAAQTRFTQNPALRHLENHWPRPKPFADSVPSAPGQSLRLVTCADPEAEAILAAHEILRFA